jgi:hypothetical protein
VIATAELGESLDSLYAQSLPPHGPEDAEVRLAVAHYDYSALVYDTAHALHMRCTMRDAV